MKVFVFTDGQVATLVREGSPEEDGMRQLPHLHCEAEHECDTLDQAIVWFNQWSQLYFCAPLRQL